MTRPRIVTFRVKLLGQTYSVTAPSDFMFLNH